MSNPNNNPDILQPTREMTLSDPKTGFDFIVEHPVDANGDYKRDIDPFMPYKDALGHIVVPQVIIEASPETPFSEYPSFEYTFPSGDDSSSQTPSYKIVYPKK